MKQIINGKLYNTENAALVAHDRYWDGHNWERHGRNTYLYKTAKGNFFLCRTTLWQGERDYIEPVTVEEAVRWFEDLPEKEVVFEEAFPGITIEEA